MSHIDIFVGLTIALLTIILSNVAKLDWLTALMMISGFLFCTAVSAVVIINVVS